MTAMEAGTLVDKLRAHIGDTGKRQVARDAVNQFAIRQWCDAMDDRNPAYTDPAWAAQSIHNQIVAPPAMLASWTTPGPDLRAAAAADPFMAIFAELAAAGYPSVVATGVEHDYVRYLRLGDTLAGTISSVDLSPEKQTAIGTGRFLTTVMDYSTQAGELVGRMKLGFLVFKPGTGRAAEQAPGAAADGRRPGRPRPGISRDTQFFWDGIAASELRIQRCARCRTLHHPPRVRCPACGGYELDYTVSSGRGIVYSFVEPCYPKVPAFEYPYVVGLVELEEGTRLITNIVDIDPETVEIGQPVELVFRRTDPELVLPMFRSRRAPRRETTLRAHEVKAGDRLPPCPIDITATLIVHGAHASRDFLDMHYDRDAARARGLPDIVMNILTTAGLCGRYIGDWAGPEAVFRRLKFRLGVSNHPQDVMTMYGSVRAVRPGNGHDTVEVDFRGYNYTRRGDHVTGSVVIEVPSRGRR